MERAPRVLLIEDNSTVGRTMRDGLVLSGYEVRVARSGTEGLAALKQQRPDAVLTDLLMPDCDGIEVLRAIQKELPDLPVIAMTGGGRIGASLLQRVALILGARRVLTKPFTFGELGRALEAVLVASRD